MRLEWKRARSRLHSVIVTAREILSFEVAWSNAIIEVERLSVSDRDMAETLSAERCFLRRSTLAAPHLTPSRGNVLGCVREFVREKGVASDSLILGRTSGGRPGPLGDFPRHAVASCCKDSGVVHVPEAALHLNFCTSSVHCPL